MLEKSIFRNHPTTIKVLLHISFWLFFMGAIATVYNTIDNRNSWLLFLKDLASTLIIFYISAYIVIPKFLVKKKYILATISFLAMYLMWILLSQLAGTMTLRYLSPNEILEKLLEQSIHAGSINWYRYSLLTSYRLDFVYIIGLPLALKLISVIMRYLLYISNKPAVSIKDEMSFITDYIDLERLRFEKNAKIDVIQNIDSYRYSIVPIILFPFIENAFKHSATSKDNSLWIKVEINVHEGLLLLQVLNSYEKRTPDANYIGGIGIDNAKKRLELNYDKTDYTLYTESLANTFKVSLSLRLE